MGHQGLAKWGRGSTARRNGSTRTFRSPRTNADLCASRVEKGHVPTCVKHCQAKCLQYGDLEELSKELARKPKQMLFSGNQSE